MRNLISEYIAESPDLMPFYAHRQDRHIHTEA